MGLKIWYKSSEGEKVDMAHNTNKNRGILDIKIFQNSFGPPTTLPRIIHIS